MENRVYNLFLRDSIFDPNDSAAVSRKKATYKRHPAPESKFLYKVWIYLDGRDLPFVESVRYFLHPTFRNPEMRVEKSFYNPNFAIVIWTWGVFNVRAEITLITGETVTVNHYLTYTEEITSDEEIQWMPASGSSAVGALS